MSLFIHRSLFGYSDYSALIVVFKASYRRGHGSVYSVIRDLIKQATHLQHTYDEKMYSEFSITATLEEA